MLVRAGISCNFCRPATPPLPLLAPPVPEGLRQNDSRRTILFCSAARDAPGNSQEPRQAKGLSCLLPVEFPSAQGPR